MKKVLSATKTYGEVLEQLKRLYPRILRQCKKQWPKSDGEITLCDIVHETIIKLLSDEKAAEITDDEEFVKYFLYRANTTIFQAHHDKKKQKKAYAYYKIAQKSQADEED